MDRDEESAVTKRWLSWCQEHQFAHCVEYNVPSGILPASYKGTLIDVKVHGGKKRRCPDDKIYSEHADLRQKVARGNCVLEIKSNSDLLKDTAEAGGDDILKGHNKGRYFFVTFALRKFSGGFGDEDEADCVQNMWNLYFLKSPESADKIVATIKANGEAAHVSCRVLCGIPYFIIGSKNVHLLARNIDDVERYTESRFEFARTIARTFFKHTSEKMGVERLEKLVQYLNETRCTAVFEILQPENEHIVDLSYLEHPELQFICWAEPYSENECAKLCWMPPNDAIEKARSFHLQTVDYTVIPSAAAEQEMLKIRADVGYEGKVLYFVDHQGNVFGMVKKKTCWYIILRAIREKTAYFLSRKESLAQIRIRVAKRIREIQTWIGFSDRYYQVWTDLAMGFIEWAVSHSKASSGESRTHFPRLWNTFIKSSEKYANLYKNLEYQ